MDSSPCRRRADRTANDRSARACSGERRPGECGHDIALPCVHRANRQPPGTRPALSSPMALRVAFEAPRLSSTQLTPAIRVRPEVGEIYGRSAMADFLVTA